MTATDMRETLKWKCKDLLLPFGDGAETFSLLDELYCTRENLNIIIIIIIVVVIISVAVYSIFGQILRIVSYEQTDTMAWTVICKHAWHIALRPTP
jgi:hypothetical protein